MLQGQIRSDFVLAPGGVSPHIVLDTQGQLHATWVGRGVYYGFFDSLGNAIKPTKKIVENGFKTTPRLAVSEEHLVVAWTSFIPAACSDIDGILFCRVNDNILGFVDYYFAGCNTGTPDVRYLNDSTFITVWTGNGPLTPSPLTGIYGLMFTNSLRAIGDTLLFSDDVPEQSHHINTRIAKCSRYGDTIVIWVAQGPLLGWNIFGRHLTKDGTPQNSTFVISENSNYSFAWGLSAVMSVDESFTVAWTAQDNDTSWNVYRRRFNAEGVPITLSEKISEDPVSRFAEVDLAMDNDGKQVMVWDGLRNNVLKVIAQRFAADGTPIGANFLISGQVDTVSQTVPSVVLNNDKIFTAWTVADTIPGTGIIWANILDFNNPQVGVERRQSNHPNSFYLHQNYPNPFLRATTSPSMGNPMTNIKYEISRRAPVQIIIYNVLGEEIVALEKKEAPPGIHEVRWNGKNAEGQDVPSGVYLYRLTVGGYSQTRKMLLVR